jgi:hypothetical protein
LRWVTGRNSHPLADYWKENEKKSGGLKEGLILGKPIKWLRQEACITGNMPAVLDVRPRLVASNPTCREFETSGIIPSTLLGMIGNCTANRKYLSFQWLRKILLRWATIGMELASIAMTAAKRRFGSKHRW